MRPIMWAVSAPHDELMRPSGPITVGDMAAHIVVSLPAATLDLITRLRPSQSPANVRNVARITSRMGTCAVCLAAGVLVDYTSARLTLTRATVIVDACRACIPTVSQLRTEADPGAVKARILYGDNRTGVRQ